MTRSLSLAHILLVSVACMTTACPAGGVEAADNPNILLLYIDNVGYGDLGCYGNHAVQTPRIDRLAAEGVRCTDFYVSASSCTPSRGALLTGRHPLRNGLAHQLHTTENWNGIGLPQRERIIPHYLRQAGYATACFGKWNIGFAPGSRPTERGFDKFLGFRSGNINYYTHVYHGEYDMFLGTERHKVEGYSTDLFADAASDFIRRRSARPWFVYLPFNAAHSLGSANMAPGEKPEWQVPARYLERYGWPADDPDEKHRYLAVLAALDDAIGRVLDTVDDLKLRERTLVILISDNGAFLLPGVGLEWASNEPFRDGGLTAYEGGVRVPAIFRWPGTIEPGTVCSAMLSHLDALPLCLAVAGLPAPQDRVLDGRNPLPTLTGEAESPHARLAFSYGTGSGLRQSNLKLVRSAPDAPWELYDLAADPGESENLAGSRPGDLALLVSEFEHWLTEVRTDASEPAPRPAAKQPGKQSGKQPAGVLVSGPLASVHAMGVPVERAELAADYEMLLAVFPEEHAGYGLDPAGVVDHQPMTYGLVLSAESLRAADRAAEDARRRVRSVARWLIDNRDLDHDGKPGWGLPQAWDAGGDGTTNPPHTCYTITTAIVLEGLVDALEVPGLWTADEAREIREVVGSVLLRWCRELWRTGYGGGFFQYSDQAADDFFSINAPAMMLSPQARFLKYHGASLDDDARDLIRRRMDDLARACVHTVELRDGCPFWDYMPLPNREQRRKPNDAVHQAYILWGIETYRECGGEVELPWTHAQAVSSCERFWKDGQLLFYAQDEPRLSDGAKTQPANLWGSGAVLAVAARWGTLDEIARSRAALVAAHGPLPRQREYPVRFRDDPRFFPRHAAHVLWGLAWALRRVEAAPIPREPAGALP